MPAAARLTFGNDQNIHTIRISDEVCQSKILPLDLIAEGVSFLHRDGIIVLEGAIDEAHIDHLDKIMTAEALQIAQSPDKFFNFGQETGNIDQAPPFKPELMYQDIWANPLALSIVSHIIGPQPMLHYVGGNTALQANPKGRQPVHADICGLHPIHAPFSYIFNIALTSTSPKNGATELWLGSHLVSTPDCHVGGSDEGILPIREDVIEQRRKHSPPIQPCIRKGSLIIRDLRLWHAGMPNLTSIPRIVLAFVYMPAWYRCPSRLVLPCSVKSLVESWENDMRISVRWIDDNVSHLELSSEHIDFASDWEGFHKWSVELCSLPDYAPIWY